MCLDERAVPSSNFEDGSHWFNQLVWKTLSSANAVNSVSALSNIILKLLSCTANATRPPSNQPLAHQLKSIANTLGLYQPQESIRLLLTLSIAGHVPAPVVLFIAFVFVFPIVCSTICGCLEITVQRLFKLNFPLLLLM